MTVEDKESYVKYMGKENFEEDVSKLTKNRDNYIKPLMRYVTEKWASVIKESSALRGL
jgi:hypothetical protein